MREETYDELCTLLNDFENATDNDRDPDWLSDGEWLDVFYGFCARLRKEMQK